MKYKVGDKVRIVSKWVSGCYENPEGKMDKYLGKTMTIKSVCGEMDPTYKMYEDQQDPNRCGGWNWLAPSIAGLARMESIRITADGDKVIAVLKNGKEIVKRAEAKCSPRDTFDFAIGANLAYMRLMGEPADPTAGEEKANTNKKPMTCREKLEQEHPGKVSGNYHGGCYGCPHKYGYAKKECKGLNKCRECWDRPVEQPEETKQPENALKIEIGKKYKLKEWGAVKDHMSISQDAWDRMSKGAIIPIRNVGGDYLCENVTERPYIIPSDAFECEWVDKQETQPQFKVGDLVKVVDKGRTYSRYQEWFENHAPEYVSKFKRTDAPENGEAGVIRVIAPHDKCDDSADICLIECGGNRAFAIGFDGIAKM